MKSNIITSEFFEIDYSHISTCRNMHICVHMFTHEYDNNE